MKKRVAQCVVLMTCVLCITVFRYRITKNSASQTEVNEIPFQTAAPLETQAGDSGTENPGHISGKETADPSQIDKNIDGKGQPSGNYEKIISKAKIKEYGGTIQVGESGYELYNYIKDSAHKYVTIVNNTAKKLKGKANVYDIVAPTSIGITLPDNKVKKVNSSNQDQAIKAMYRGLDKNVTGISLYDTLMQHRKEYIYFRTDHHWTQKGAYYAYQAFCREKGISPHELSEYSAKNFGPYLGSFYLDTNKSKELRGDSVKAYYPVDNKKIQMTYTDQHGGKYHRSIIADGKGYGTFLKYCAYIDGDNPYTVIKNKGIKDGSACVVVKESYANAFVPFLADHYQKIYVIDYRYWKGSVSSLAKKNKVEDVIFMNNISMTRNAYLLGKLAQVQ